MPTEALHPDEALRLVLHAAPPPVLELVPLGEAQGRALSKALPALVDQPPFDKSAMDGFAHDPASPAELYRVVSAVAAGASSSRVLGPGECSRIMTGAPIPPGASAVQRVEWTEEAGKAADCAVLVRFLKPEGVSNVIRRGENLRAGEPLLSPRLLEPQDIGILAASGYGEVEVARRPLVGVVSTGDELCTPGTPLGPASIYDSNGPQLAAQARAAGCGARFYGAVRDEPGALEALLERALEECDVVLVSGGVSMGDFDYVPRALEALGVERVFHNLAMRPGKPTWFGRRGATAAFGLPGNPVSTFVNFEVLVRPHLAARMGLAHEPRVVRARLAAPLVRRGSDRVEFLPARLERAGAGEGAEQAARPLGYHGSSMLNVLAEADCLLRMELGRERIEEGSIVDARLLRA
ncbi:MAG: molybdopterin molybdotransferase MoeA [Spirochaetaceae bacterium]|nr:molybdopterin molybdotransferase MoeA [Spirochaetaceae bacterium]